MHDTRKIRLNKRQNRKSPNLSLTKAPIEVSDVDDNQINDDDISVDDSNALRLNSEMDPYQLRGAFEAYKPIGANPISVYNSSHFLSRDKENELL